MLARWYQFRTAALPRGVVVIDATDASAPLWDGPVVSVLEDLRERLQITACPEVCFLGDRHTYPLDVVLDPLLGRTAKSAVEHRQHLGRFPVAGPFLREWERTPARPVVLVTNTSVHDLEDWATDGAATAVLVYRLTGADRVTPAPWRELGPDADLGALADHLRDPVQEVRLGGAAFVLDWPGDGFTRDNGELCGLPPEGGPVKVLLACPDDRPPRAELRRASGARLACALEPTDPPAAEAIPLADSAANVMRLWRTGRDFFCLTCSANHKPGQLRCRGKADKLLLPELAARPLGTAWGFKFDGTWTATPFPRGAAVAGDLVLLSEHGRWSARTFVDGEWQPAEATELLVALGEDEFLVPG